MIWCITDDVAHNQLWNRPPYIEGGWLCLNAMRREFALLYKTPSTQHCSSDMMDKGEVLYCSQHLNMRRFRFCNQFFASCWLDSGPEAVSVGIWWHRVSKMFKEANDSISVGKNDPIQFSECVREVWRPEKIMIFHEHWFDDFRFLDFQYDILLEY